MTRVPLTLSDISPVFQENNPAQFARRRDVKVFARGETETPVPVYSAEAGGVELTQPLRTDNGGRIEGQAGQECWVEIGRYDLLIGDRTVPWEPGSVAQADDGQVEGSLTVISSPLDRMPRGLKDDGSDQSEVINEALAPLLAEGIGRLRLPEAELTIEQPVMLSHDFRGSLECMGRSQSILVKKGLFTALQWGDDPRQGTPTALAASVKRGDEQLELVSVAGLAPKQKIELHSNENFGSDGQDKGEWLQIREINTGTKTVTLYSSPLFDYSITGDGGTETVIVQPLVMPWGGELGGIGIREYEQEDDDKLGSFLRLWGRDGFTLDGYRAENCGNRALQIRDCYGGEFCNFDIRGGIDNLGNGQQGYGLDFYGASTRVRAHHGEVVGGRHGVDTNNDEAGDKVSTRECTVEHVDVTGTTSAPFDTHMGTRYMAFKHCKALYASGGMQLRSPDCIVHDFEVRGCESGIFINGAGNTHGDRPKLSEIVIENVTRNAFKAVGADGGVLERFRIEDIYDENAVAVYIGREGSDESTVPKNWIVSDGTIRNIGGEGSAATGYGLYFDAGDGHSWDQIRVGGVEHALRVDEPCTNFSYGRLIPVGPISQVRHPHVPTSTIRPMEFSGSVNPEGYVEAPVGSLYHWAGVGVCIKATGNQETGWKLVSHA